MFRVPNELVRFLGLISKSIHSIDGLSDIDRLNYLNKYLCGSTETWVSSLTLSSQNFKGAISTLQKIFGKPQELISPYMDSSLKL